MPYETEFYTDNRMFVPEDPEASARVARLRELGLESRPYPEFDQFARDLALAVGAGDGYAMVNFIGTDEQYFAGLYTPGEAQPGASGDAPGRTMTRDQGFCPHVVVRRKALVLEDVCDYPRFAGNRVVDELGIRSYLGAPLIDNTGTALGTICVIATEPHPWGHPGLHTIKSMAAELIERIQQR